MEKRPDPIVIPARGETAGLGDLSNPLDYIAEDHMREREICALIDQIGAIASFDGVQIDRILAFLDIQLPQHLADEEIDLFPIMLKRCDPEDEIEKVIAKLHADHAHARTDAPSIAKVIRAIRNPPRKPTPMECDLLTEFARQARRHLILENAIILPIARARLIKEDLKSMAASMRKRRELLPRLEG